MADEYASVAEFDMHVNPAMFVGVDDTVKLHHIEQQSRYFDSFARGKHSVPLQAPYPPEVTLCVLRLAAWSLLNYRGVNPEDAGHAGLLRDADAAERWLRDGAGNEPDISTAATTRRRTIAFFGKS